MIPAHVPIYFLTNGQLLNKSRSELILGRKNISHIMVSMDAFSDEKYRIIRGGIVEKVKKNLLEFIAERDSRGLKIPKIIINATVFKYNLDQLLPLAEFAKSLDSEFHVWPLIKDSAHYSDYWKIKRGEYVFDYKNELFETPEEKAMLQAAYEKLENFCQENSVAVYFDKFMNMPEKPFDIRQCRVPESNRIFFSNGQAKHCCLQTQPLFNWKEESAIGFDSHERHKTVLRMMSEGKVPYECAGSGCKYVLHRPADEVMPTQYIGMDEGGFRGSKLTLKTRKNELKVKIEK